MSRFLYIAIGIFMLMQISFCASGQTPLDSVRTAIYQLDKMQLAGKITDSAYLGEIYSVTRDALSTNTHFTNKELLVLLSHYRKIIWSNPTFAYQKRRYYGILANQAQMTGRGGEMLYYGSQIDKVERELNNAPSLTSLSIITGYYEEQGAMDKIREVFIKNKSFLLTLPALASVKKLKEEDLVQGSIVLQRAAMAYFALKDSTNGNAILDSMSRIINVAQQLYKSNDNVMSNLIYLNIEGSYHGAVANGSAGTEYKQIKKLEAFTVHPSTPDYLKNYSVSLLLDWKVAYFLKNYNKDSATHFLNVYIKSLEEQKVPYNQFLLKKYIAENLYHEGKYRESADMLAIAAQILDSSRSEAVKDIGDMMYARAEADEKEVLLDEARAAKRNTEQKLVIASIVFAALLITGGFIISYTRRKQRERFTEFKLNMARNIHDETGPVLLYAKALAKNNRQIAEGGAADKTELEKHIDHTIEIIRGLSHDLKSDHLHTVKELSQEVESALKKLGQAYEFTYNINVDGIGKSFLSHQQFTELKSIVLECVSNTIKHANFDRIEVSFSNEGKKLHIAYSDNGVGWVKPEDESKAGIGLKNMEERSEKLQGSFGVNSNHPNGYKIAISVPLR